jgi:predicted PurR-regulated permease PerM
MLFVSLLGMVITRHYVRLLELQGQFDPSTIPVKPQWSVFAVFLLFFVVAIGVVWYMVRVFFGKREKAGN